jgi:hypothetical protein
MTFEAMYFATDYYALIFLNFASSVIMADYELLLTLIILHEHYYLFARP